MNHIVKEDNLYNYNNDESYETLLRYLYSSNLDNFLCHLLSNVNKLIEIKHDLLISLYVEKYGVLMNYNDDPPSYN